MALQRMYETSQGETVNAYYKIDSMAFVFGRKACNISVGIYKSKGNSDAKKPAYEAKRYLCNAYDTYFSNDSFANSNPRKQGYLYLKTLTEFNQATDV